MREADVIVVGAGLSGCTAAAILAQKGYDVVVVSRDSGTAYHLPESWMYNAPSSVISLGIEKEVLLGSRQQSRSVFCSPDDKFSIQITVNDASEKIRKGSLVWVDRNQLDRVLLETAMAQGATFRPLSRILDCQLSPTQVTLSLESQSIREEWVASHMIDATGKTAFLAGHLNLPTEEKKLDPRVAYFSHFESSSKVANEMKIMPAKGGYLFCLPLSDKRISIGCVIAENLVPINSSPDEIFAQAISSSSYLNSLIAQSTRVLPIIPIKNSQRICLEPSGSRYRLIGEAAAFLDPFFCPGIDFAFFSAEKAVETIIQDDPQGYKSAVNEWLENSKLSVYEKIEESEWKAILRLFADPHLPFVVPLALTQAFGRITEKEHLLKSGVQISRGAYELASR